MQHSALTAPVSSYPPGRVRKGTKAQSVHRDGMDVDCKIRILFSLTHQLVHMLVVADARGTNIALAQTTRSGKVWACVCHEPLKCTVAGSKLLHAMCTQSVSILHPVWKLKGLKRVGVLPLSHTDIEEFVLSILDSAQRELVRLPLAELKEGFHASVFGAIAGI